MKTSLFHHPKDIRDPLTGLELTGMTIAGTTLSVLQVVINVFISYYYTNVLGLGAAFVGTLLLVTRIADGFSDLGMGVIITKTRSRFGKARPWAIRMSLPLLLSVILAFWAPPEWNTTAKSVYATVTYFLMITVAITPAGITGSVLSTNMTVNNRSRRIGSMLSAICVMIGSVAGNLAVVQITEAFGDTHMVWRGIAAGFGLLAFLGQLAQFFFTRERDFNGGTQKNAVQVSVKESLPALYKNKYFILMCFFGLFSSLDAAMSGCVIYYVKYVLFNANLIGAIGVVTLIPTLAGISLIPLVFKKTSPKALMLAGLAIKTVTFAVNLLFPANIPLFLTFTAIRGFVGSPMMIYGGVYLLNTIEYGEYKTGVRANNLIVSVSSVAGKIGSGFGGALIGWLLGLGGYVGTAAVQPEAARSMIVYICFLVPIIAAAAQFALLCFYNLDKKYAHIMAKLQAA